MILAAECDMLGGTCAGETSTAQSAQPTAAPYHEGKFDIP